MKSQSVLGLLVGLLVVPAAALATERPTSFDFEFSGTGGEIFDTSIQTFIAMPGLEDMNLDIAYLELAIAGLTHDSPADLNIFLLDPFGGGIEIMDDRGDQISIDGLTIIFSDFFGKAEPLPANLNDVVGSSIYQTDGLGNFTDYTTTGSDEWRLVVIDDSTGDGGSFTSFTLRGVVVPEPATLSLLAIGAMTLFRRRAAA